MYAAYLRSPGATRNVQPVGASGEGVQHAHRAKTRDRRVPSVRSTLLRTAARTDGRSMKVSFAI
jgi:hypothetical protein